MCNYKALLTACGLGLLAACGGGGGCETCGDKTGAPVTSTISGAILDKNNAPVAGVKVRVYHHNLHTTML